jgi:hypothetical protein
MITVRRDDLETVMAIAAVDMAIVAVEERDIRQEVADAWQRLTEAKDASAEAEPEPPLPDGEFGHVELPGFVQHTGWVTEGTRAGCPVLVIRDWDGRKIAEVVPQAMRQFIALPTPLKRPESQAALPAGAGLDAEYDDANPF